MVANASKNNFSSILVTAVGTTMLIAFGAIGFWFLENKLASSKETTPLLSPTSVTPNNPTPSLSESNNEPTPTLTVSSTNIPVSDIQLIKQAFVQKYKKNFNDVNVEIQQQEGIFSKGTVSFAGEAGGGMWLAYKENGQWSIVYDGNGTIPCNTVNQPHNFPSSMVSECWDEVNKSLIQR